jgi:hypothetical protein
VAVLALVKRVLRLAVTWLRTEDATIVLLVAALIGLLVVALIGLLVAALMVGNLSCCWKSNLFWIAETTVAVLALVGRVVRLAVTWLRTEDATIVVSCSFSDSNDSPAIGSFNFSAASTTKAITVALALALAAVLAFTCYTSAAAAAAIICVLVL